MEVLPEAKDKERRRIQLFWAIMYEVCNTFCVWRAFCKSFCQKFNPNEHPFFNNTFDLVITLNLPATINKNNVGLFSIVTQICEDDVSCTENCLSTEIMEIEEDHLSKEEVHENILKALYELVKKYLIKCANTNDKPSTVPDSFTTEQFCREITTAGSEFTQQCINWLDDVI